MQDSQLNDIFASVHDNISLIKFRLSGISLSNYRNIETLAEYLKHHDSLQELDLSYANL